jgi:hypothetical protein
MESQKLTTMSIRIGTELREALDQRARREALCPTSLARHLIARGLGEGGEQQEKQESRA